MNPANFFKIKMLWDRFTANHPKFPRFLQAAAQASLGAEDIIEIKITKANGDTIASNIKLTEEDLELFKEMKDMVTG